MRRNVIVVIPLALLVSSTARAERPCDAGRETYLECLNRIHRDLAEGAGAEEVAAASTARLLESLTSEGAGSEGGSTRDYVSRFFAALGLGDTSTEGADLILNFRTDFLDLGPGQKAVARAVLHEAEPHAGLVAALPEESRSERSGQLDDSLGDFDDVTLELSWNRESTRLGRRGADTARERLASATELAAPELEELAAIQTRFLLLLREDPDALERRVPVEDPPPGSPLAVFEAELRTFASSLVAERDLLSQLLADLGGNQPQLHFGVAYRRRDGAAGPSEVLARLTYEHGFVSLNSFERWRRDHQCESGLACASRYRQQGDALAASGAARLAISLEFARNESFEFPMTEGGARYRLEEVDRRVGALSFSRRIGRPPTADAAQDDRILCEVSARYEDVGDDPARRDRLVAQAGFSRKVSGDLSAGITVVYANRPEFRGEVDEELSARLGLKFSSDVR